MGMKMFEKECPICGTKIDTLNVSPFVTDIKGEKYYSCRPEHMREFEKNPEKYIKKK